VTLASLSGTSWRVIEISGEEADITAELHFDGDSGFAGGQGPCNSYGGEYMNKTPGEFKMGGVFTTQLSCDVRTKELGYIASLRLAVAYETTPDLRMLSVLDDEDNVVLRFEAF